MISRRHLFSNLECSGVDAEFSHFLNGSITNTLISVSSAIYKAMALFIRSAKVVFFATLLCFISCAVPEQDGAGVLQAPKVPNVDIVPSIRTRASPTILAVIYIKTIGRIGQGAGEFLGPMGMVLNSYQQLYVADTGNNRVQVIDMDGVFIAEFGSFGWRDGEFDYPTDLAISLDTLYVADTGNHRVQYCNLVNRIFYPIVTTTEDYQFDAPEGIGIGRNGEVFVVDTLNHRWIQFSKSLTPINVMGSFGSNREQFWNPTDIVVNPDSTVYVVDTGNHRIVSYDFSGNPTHTWGEEGSELGQFREPKRLALDVWNYLYITDSGNRRVQIFTQEGLAVIEFTEKTLLNPCGIAVSQNGQVFVSDTEAGDIKVFKVIFKKDSASDSDKIE